MNALLWRSCPWCLPLVAIVIAAGTAFFLFIVVNNSAPPLDFGASHIEMVGRGGDSHTVLVADDMWLSLDGDHKVTQIRLDQKPKIVLHKVSWLRNCQVREPQFIKIDGHPRIDVGTHYVVQTIIPKDGKSRPIMDERSTMGDLTYGLSGSAEFWMEVAFNCWGREFVYDTPHILFEVLPAAPMIQGKVSTLK